MALGEFDIIDKYFAPLARSAGALGLKDDAALLAPAAGMELVLTQDAIVEGVHFRPDDPIDLVARKLLRVNLSDLAAKGARPLGYLLTCAWPASTDEALIAAFARGLQADQNFFDVSLLGGDTVATNGPLVFSLTALGEVTLGAAALRSGAQAGDGIFVTGEIGASFLGLQVLEGNLDIDGVKSLTGRYQVPEPRVSLGQGLSSLASAMVDVSDGLLADAGHLAEASGVEVVIQGARVPLPEGASNAISKGSVTLVDLLTGGDDYELLFSAPADQEAALRVLSEKHDIAISRIGDVKAGSGVKLLDESGGNIHVKTDGYAHF